MKKLIVFAGVVIVLIIAYNLFTFTVDETKKAAVLRFGEIVKVVEEPGLYFKVPFINKVVYLEDRVLSYDIQPRDILTSDQKRLIIDNYAIWRVGEPKQFIEATGGSLINAQSRIDDIVYSDLRNILAEHTLNEIVSEKRLQFLLRVTELSRGKLGKFGIKLIDVRIKRADLPSEIEQAVYARMRSERERIAAQLRAEGKERAKQITSSADKEKAIILAEARKEAERIKGEGDAQALEIYASAYNQDPEFYRFWRSLESYKISLASASSPPRIVLSTGSDYLQFLERIQESSEP
ncbi:MAG: protease modulator HflC [Candidatus Bipolaricaulota bacterium]|nr:protease modulator HflC [Candidatus Bipolaricaulota bacterium]